MQLHSTQLTGLLGAILLSAGLAAPITLGDEVPEPTGPAVQVETVEKDGDQHTRVGDDGAKASSEKTQDEAMIEVRISLPDGRTIIRLEPAGRTSARRIMPAGLRVSKTLADGSRVSYGTGGVAGGSNSSSAARSGSGGGSGGGGGASAGGGSGGGGGSGSSGSVASPSSGGGAAGSAARAYTGADDSEASSNAESSSSEGSSDTGSVHTIGDPIYNDDGAVGGQRVEFHGAGMGAAVIGNTVYFIGVELVRADQSFEIVDGTRIGSDSVMQVEGYQSSGTDLISSWNTAASPIKLDFASDTVVDLVMLSLPADASAPAREQRTWRVRIR